MFHGKPDPRSGPHISSSDFVGWFCVCVCLVWSTGDGSAGEVVSCSFPSGARAGHLLSLCLLLWASQAMRSPPGLPVGPGVWRTGCGGDEPLHQVRSDHRTFTVESSQLFFSRCLCEFHGLSLHENTGVHFSSPLLFFFFFFEVSMC